MGRDAQTDANAAVYDDPSVAAQYDTQGYQDLGELTCLLQLAPQVRGGRVVDIGCGAGRTTSLLRLLTDDYLGIDYSPAMVARARRRHPGMDLRVDDARTLDDVPDGQADLTVFSFNGIDTLDHDGRAAALRQMARVTRPGGWVLWSTLNLDGPAYLRRPWLPQPLPTGRGVKPAARRAVALARHTKDLPGHLRAYQANVHRSARGPGWQTAPLLGHGFRLVVHFCDLGHVRRETAQVGLHVERLVTEAGVDVTQAPTTDARYVHVLARRAAD